MSEYAEFVDEEIQAIMRELQRLNAEFNENRLKFIHGAITYPEYKARSNAVCREMEDLRLRLRRMLELRERLDKNKK
jgi:hypothetical protein